MARGKRATRAHIHREAKNKKKLPLETARSECIIIYNSVCKRMLANIFFSFCLYRFTALPTDTFASNPNLRRTVSTISPCINDAWAQDCARHCHTLPIVAVAAHRDSARLRGENVHANGGHAV